jgi:chemotaxis protein MotB
MKYAYTSVLDDISDLVNTLSCEVRVEGHTDNIPIENYRFPSNWELSSARASSVVRYLHNIRKVHPSRLVAMGFGEYRPLIPNDNIDHRARNRRVEIFLNWGESFRL